jgi:hypothetical protein
MCKHHVHFWRRQHTQHIQLAAICNSNLRFKPCISLQPQFLVSPRSHCAGAAHAWEKLTLYDPCGLLHAAFLSPAPHGSDSPTYTRIEHSVPH